MIKRTLLSIGVCLALGTGVASAHVGPDDIAADGGSYITSDGSVLKTGLDTCLRSGDFSDDAIINKCEGIEDEVEEVAEAAPVEEAPEPAPPAPVAKIVTSDLTQEALFGFDSADLTDAGMSAMESLFSQVDEFKGVTNITVTGYTDNTGPDDYNMQLSERRAAAIGAVLQDRYPDTAVEIVGKGEADPAASNDTMEGRKQNRRVEVELTASKMMFE